MIAGSELVQFLTYCASRLGVHLLTTIRGDGYADYFDFSKISYLDIKDAKLHYLARNRELKIDKSGDIDYSNFQTGKPAKIIRKVLSRKGLELFSDSDLEEFNNCFISTFSISKLTFLRHRNFAEVYQKKVRKADTILAKSCMRNKNSDYFQFYEDIPECSILECLDGEQLVGRALLWEIEGQTYMDRVYAENPLILEEYFKYAITNKFYRKWAQNFSTSHYWVDLEGNPVYKVLSLKVQFTTKYRPYLDTFKYYDEANQLLHNGFGKVDQEFTETNGKYNTRDYTFTKLLETEYCKVSNTWEDPRDVIVLTGGFYINQKVSKSKSILLQQNRYYYKDPTIGYFYNPLNEDYEYKIIDKNRPVIYLSDFVMYIDLAEEVLKEEASTIYGKKRLHKMLNLMINEKWNTTRNIE